VLIVFLMRRATQPAAVDAAPSTDGQ